MPVKVENVVRDRSELLEKLFQEACYKICSCVALLPVRTIDIRYANVLLFECIFEVVDNNRSESIPTSASHKSSNFSKKSTYARVVLPTPAGNKVNTPLNGMVCRLVEHTEPRTP